MPLLTQSDFQRAAFTLGCAMASIMAVCRVEAPDGGFDGAGQPRILFEGHKFSAATGGRFDKTHPTISYPTWTRQFYARGPNADARNAGEHLRLQQAAALDRTAAMQSASWGMFQVLGANYAASGFASLQEFLNAMYAGEVQQLDAFVQFVLRNHGLASALRDQRWADFARRYNGPRYAENAYDIKLEAAYRRYAT